MLCGDVDFHRPVSFVVSGLVFRVGSRHYVHMSYFPCDSFGVIKLRRRRLTRNTAVVEIPLHLVLYLLKKIVFKKKKNIIFITNDNKNRYKPESNRSVAIHVSDNSLIKVFRQRFFIISLFLYKVKFVTIFRYIKPHCFSGIIFAVSTHKREKPM